MGGGLGIGLSMVKEIINTMNGDIELISEPRQGSLFKIILPITQPQFESGMASQDKDLSSKAG